RPCRSPSPAAPASTATPTAPPPSVCLRTSRTTPTPSSSSASTRPLRSHAVHLPQRRAAWDRPAVAAPILPDGVRRPAVLLWAVGAGLAGFTAVLAAAHSEVGFAAAYVVVAAGLAVLAHATRQRRRT